MGDRQEKKEGPRLAIQDGRIPIRSGEARLRVAAVGDLILSDDVASVLERSGTIDPFRPVRPLLSRADLLFGNLEYPLTRTGSRHPLVRHRTRKGPPEMADLLAKAGFSVLGLANNHILDCLVEGLADTVRTLAARGIRAVGAGSSLALARSPAVIEKNGLRLGFLAYTFPHYQIATDSIPGCAPADPDLMREDVRALRARVDHAIVSIHANPDAGTDFFFYPSLRQQRIARSLVEEGASAVLCHHVHAVQGIEIDRGAVIAHGLGSFLVPIGDSYLRSAPSPYAERIGEGMIVFLEFGREGLLSLTIEPTVIEENLSVRPSLGEERAEFFRHLSAISAPLSDERELSRRAPDRSLRAKAGRALAKTKRIGLASFLREIAGDGGDRIDRLLFEPGRERAFREKLRRSPLRIEPNPPLASDGRSTAEKTRRRRDADVR
ncbi:MAG: CapA family protein [Candidatus Eisenbacteria bacterium]|nr:CapA family protein [Candidatus Eisenbacteria bacterium]